MIALSAALAYLGTLAALCWWRWHEARHDEKVTQTLASYGARLDNLVTRAAAWDQAASDVENLRLEKGLKPRK